MKALSPEHRISMTFATAKRIVRHLLVERSYERYYSAHGWDKSYTEGYVLDSDDQDARYGALLALMQRYDQGETILDAGCGEGLLEQKYRQLSPSRMIGIDYSQEAIKLARAKGIPRCHFACIDYRHCDLGQRYGMIVFNESLYYIENVSQVLGTLSHQLTRQGVLIISMFDRLVTRRIWKAIIPQYAIRQSVAVKDETHHRRWHIRVLTPHAPASSS
jgi:2-polyprenyl-3-methyl-5-hydroxy-6-metoxy-1,4-benzoquinol methylase